MNQGNQFYLEIQIIDEEENCIDIRTIQKIQFNIGKLTKEYVENGEEVTYDEENKCFKIWLTQGETFAFDTKIKVEARVLFKNKTILGSYIRQEYVYDSIGSVIEDVKTENS